MKYIHRTLEKFFLNAHRQFPVTMVVGPRQVGKTTFLRHLSKDNRTYVTLDDPIVRALAREDPELFLQRYKPPVLIDEIQYAPELLPHIKMKVDREHKTGSFWLTGSQQFHLMKGVSESLAGRVGIINLQGLSLPEMFGNSGTPPFLPNSDMKTGAILELDSLYRIIWHGCFPAIAANPDMECGLFYSSFIQTYLQRDVRDLAKVGDEMRFLRFIRAAAARTGQLLNMADLARDADVAQNTAKNWLSILQASGIIYLLEPYYGNLTKRMVKTPKLYFLDTGLCSYLTEWTSPANLEAGAMTGAVFESWCIAEVIKSYWHNGQHAPICFYRDKDKKEIDLLIVRDGTVYPVEFKKSASPKKSDAGHFSVLKNLKMPIGHGALICLCRDIVPLTDKIDAVPVATFSG